MTRILTRNTRLRRVLSLWVTCAFVLSLTNVGFAVPVESTEGVEVSASEAVAPQEEQVAPEQPEQDEQKEAPVEESPAEPEAPPEEPVVDPTEEPVVDPAPEPSVEADPVTQEPEKSDEPAPAEENLLEEPKVAAEAEPAIEPTAESEVEPLALAPLVFEEPIEEAVPTTVWGGPPLGSGGLRVQRRDLSGTFNHTFRGVDIEISVTKVKTSEGEVFSFSSNWPVVKVVAMGLTSANVYTYSSGARSGSGLHAPRYILFKKWADICHIDFYFAEPQKIEVIKFHDLDGDGVHDDGEPTLDGWMIQLLKGDDVIESAATVDGKVMFDAVPPGAYALDEVLTRGWMNTTPLPLQIEVPNSVSATHKKPPCEPEPSISTFMIGNKMLPDVTKTFVLAYADAPTGAEFSAVYNLVEGPDVEVPLLSVGGGEFSGSVELPWGSVIDSVMWKAMYGDTTYMLGSQSDLDEELVEDAVNRFTYSASVSGHKFGDLNADGVWNAAEPGLTGWTIGLYKAAEQVQPSALPAPAAGFELVAQTMTGAGGAYSFNGLLPGTYYVAEETRAGWKMTVSPEGTFAVFNGTALAGLDFGNTEEALPFTLFEFSKSANVTAAAPGDLVTYTLTYGLASGSATWTAPIPVIDDYDERYMAPVDVAGGVVADGRITWTDQADLLPGQVRTIVYTMRVIDDMPIGNTRVDNAALLDVQAGYRAAWAVTVQVDDPFLPFTPVEETDEDPFLPFTGGEGVLIVLAALAAGALGFTFRRLAVQAK